MVTETKPIETRQIDPGMIPDPIWFKQLCNIGFRFPDSYIVYDVETTGLDVERDYIVQFGHLVVENRIPREPVQTVLDWTRCNFAEHGNIRQRLYEVTHDFMKNNRSYKFTYERIAHEGVDPLCVLDIYHELFSQHQEAGCYFLTHNGFRYDSRIINSHFQRFCNSNFKLNNTRLIDTGLLEKACQLDMTMDVSESLCDFYSRIDKQYAKGVYWSLDRHCMVKYEIPERHHLDMNEAHTAGFDCYATHLLMEEFREMSGIK